MNRARPVPAIAALVLLAAQPMALEAQGRSGREVYDAACAACHGRDGRGQPSADAAYPIVPPDFTDCQFGPREAAGDWLAVSHDGGPARGFSPLMPAFGGALTLDELERAVAHIRTFCAEPAWPRGELNLPRALVTGKAFPEDEAVLTVAAGPEVMTSTFVYEKRLGPRNQIEIVAPFARVDRDGASTSGVGDMKLAFKRAYHHDLSRGRIASAAIELVLPTGSAARGTGGGTLAFEPALTFGQILPRDMFLQLQAGGAIAVDGDDELFWRGALGRTYTEGAFGRAWSPMLELLASRTLSSGAVTHWDILPQVQVTLNRRQHIRVSAGVRVPVSHRRGRHAQGMVYLLWDWFDGGLRDGW